MGRNGRLAVVLLLIIGASVLGYTGSALAQTESMSLEQCIDMALEKNLGIISKEAAADRAGLDRLDAWGAALPSLSTDARYSFSKSYGPMYIQLPDTAYIGTDPGSKRYSTGLGLSMTLFDGGYTWFRIKQANQAKRAAENDLQDAINGTAYQVKIAYYTLLREIMLKKVQQDALARSKKQLEVTSSRYDLGSASLSEKLKAQVTVANDSLQLLQRENSIRAAEFNLNVIMKRDVALRLNPADSMRAQAMSEGLDELLRKSAEMNPALKRSKAEMDAAKTGVWMSKRSWLPRVSASMGWSWSPTEGSDWFKYQTDDRSYSFSVSIGYDIFDGFAKKTDYSRAKLSEMTARESYQNDQNTLNSEVRQAYLDYDKSRLQLEVAELGARSAEEDMKLQQERYRLGASSILELLDAQVSLTQSQSNLVQAYFDLNKAIADIAKATGGR
ncbi:MAG: TolC family protein [bacterium]|nr:TolC family protein [bacterium]